ncbi:Source PGD [Phytophthora oleae]|uniref:Source PGD n=1 Tax=Phytophthora oleae TaxID=2107226 RepID=A0ABD3EZV4_9STRA
MLLGDSDGNRYTPIKIFKVKPSKDSAIQQENDSSRYGFGVRNWKDVRNIRAETELEVFGNSKGWWNEKLSIAFLKFHFASRVPQDYVLLLWDDFSGHWTASVRKYAAEINVVLLKVPPHATPVSQPADVAWNFPLKARLQRCWHEDMKGQLEASKGNGKRVKLKRPNRATICGGCGVRGTDCRATPSQMASRPAVYFLAKTASTALV